MSSVPGNPASRPAPLGCSMYTGILFSRKKCPNPAVTTCARCELPICKAHLRAPLFGQRFLCSSCDNYENDTDWRYHNGRWRYRYDDDDSRRGTVAGAAGGAAAGTATGTAAGKAQAQPGDLTDEDRRALSTNADGAWQGDDPADAADDTDDGGDMDDGDFDAS